MRNKDIVIDLIKIHAQLYWNNKTMAKMMMRIADKKGKYEIFRELFFFLTIRKVMSGALWQKLKTLDGRTKEAKTIKS